jgi:hypothetical protein
MSQQSKIARRSFFAVLGGAAAAGVAMKLAPKAPVTDTVDAAQTEPAHGYRLTEHIKKYYRTTTI